jgi:hypothetical protein
MQLTLTRFVICIVGASSKKDSWCEGSMLKPAQRFLLVCLIVLAIGLLGTTPFAIQMGTPHVTVAKLLGSSGLFLDIAGIIQLEVSGAFDKLIERYGDIEQYPYGPPSYITRQIIDDPDRPIRNGIRNSLFFEHRTGIGLLIAGFVLQLSAVWAWV